MRTIATVILLVVLVPASGAATVPSRPFAAPVRLAGLALSGSRVAYAVEPVGAGCRSVWVWNLATGTRTRVSGRATCAIPRTSTGLGLAEVAIANRFVAWTVQTGGNTEQNETLFAAVPGTREKVLARSHRTGDVDDVLAGSWLAHFAASSSGMFLNSWTTDRGGAVSAAMVRQVTLDGTRRYKTGEDTLFLRSASPARLASVGADGTTVHTFRGPARHSATVAGLRALALDGERLVTLTKPAVLDVRNPDAPEIALTSFPAPAGAVTALAAANGVAVFAIGRTIYAESETTGKTAVLARSTRAWRFVALNASALVYAGSQTIHVVPFRAVRAAVA
jgi:hypothetical protein